MPGDPKASEQVTRAMQSSVPMTLTWRIIYSVNGVEYVSSWTAIGETVQVPTGAVYVRYELGPDPIVGGPWLAQGGGPKV